MLNYFQTRLCTMLFILLTMCFCQLEIITPSHADYIGQDTPRVNGQWFTSGSLNPYAYSYTGQCTWYVFGRCGLANWTLNMGGTFGNAQDYYNSITNSSAKNYTPAVGAVMCFSGSDVGGVGHVAYVDQVIDNNTWIVDHYNWDLKGHYYVTTVTRDPNNTQYVNFEGLHLHFTGFVHSANESVTANSVGSNPSAADIKAKLIAAGQKWQIPPHILFGIAWQESGWRQFDSNGNTVISPDGGIGIMQLTGATAAQFDVNRLKTDIDYNIDAGAQVLNDKWNATPIIGDNDRAKLENWYYAIWAYNGFVSGSTYPGTILHWIANCPNGQWDNVAITPPTSSQIATMQRIPNTPTPIHIDANYDGIIDGNDTTPPTVTITSGQPTGAATYNTPQRIIWHIDDGGGSGIKSWGQAWDSDPGYNQFTTSTVSW